MPPPARTAALVPRRAPRVWVVAVGVLLCLSCVGALFGLPLLIMEWKWRDAQGLWGLRGRALAGCVAAAALLIIGVFVAAELAAPQSSDEAYQRGLDALAAGKHEVALKEFGQVTAGAHVADAKAKIAETNRRIEHKRRQEQEVAAKREREEAEKRAQEEKAALARERQAAEAEAARQEQAAQDFVNSCQPLEYEAVARRPDDFVNVGFVFQGKVLQTAESTSVFLVQLPGGSDWVWVEYNRQPGDSRLLEDDIVTIWARFKGLRTYTTVLNAEKTVPAFEAVGVQNGGRSTY